MFELKPPKPSTLTGQNLGRLAQLTATTAKQQRDNLFINSPQLHLFPLLEVIIYILAGIYVISMHRNRILILFCLLGSIYCAPSSSGIFYMLICLFYLFYFCIWWREVDIYTDNLGPGWTSANSFDVNVNLGYTSQPYQGVSSVSLH